MDPTAAHQHFAASFFNAAWDLLDKPDRTPAEDERMLFLSIASHCHWQHRDDYEATKASIGYWQTARVYAVLGDGRNAEVYADKCLAVSTGDEVPPFYRAYAHEARARAAALQGNTAARDEALRHAREALAVVTDPKLRDAVEADLATV